MGGVPAGSDAFFSVSPTAAAFAMQWGQAKGRLDTWFNHPRYELLNARLDAAAAPAPTLGSILRSIASGATPRRSDESLYADADDGIKFLRILNVVDGEIVEQDLKYITDAVHEGDLARSQLDAGDVLMTITGRVGSAAVAGPEHLPANINQHIARLRIDTEQCLPEYLSEWLNCPAGLEMSNRYVSGGTRAALDYGAIRNIRIPLPALTEQERLIAAMDAARKERKAKLAEADALLAGIDDYLLDALALAPPAMETRRVFAVSLGQTQSSGRIDSDYYHPERTGALRILDTVPSDLVAARLADVVSFERDQIDAPGANYLGMAQVSSHIGELTGATDTASGKCFVFQPDDVLFSRMAPALNKVYCAAMDGCCTTEFHVLRVKDRDALLPEYLAAILRSRIILSQTVHMTTGSTRPRLSNDDVANLTVPIPNLAVQGIIASEIIRRRDEARRLRGEASAGWQAAKGWFEGEALCYNRQ